MLCWTIATVMTSHAVAFTGGPPDERAGDPPMNMTCNTASCHTEFITDTGPGAFSLSGVPTTWVPNQTYNLTVNLSQALQSKWGFEVTAKDSTDAFAGTLTVTDAVNTQLGTLPYIKHTGTGTHNGVANASPGWSFDWTAPSDISVGTISFYAAGNAANGNFSPLGDYIYTDFLESVAIPEPSSMTLL